MIKWVNRFAPLYSNVKSRHKFCDIPSGTLVRETGRTEGTYLEVIYVASKTVFTGWIHMDDVEDYVRNYATNVVTIENQTPDLTDFEQYIIWKSVKQINMCGELCVANVLGISLGTLLSRWEVKEPNFFKRVFGSSGVARGTSESELSEMFTLFDRESESLKISLYQSHINRARYTIKGLNNLLKKGSVIMSVHIDKYTGLIKNSGVLHWIGLKTILAERNGQGFVTFYNPAMNCIESSSWNELMASSGTNPYGIFVPDIKGEPLIIPQEVKWVENRA